MFLRDFKRFLLLPSAMIFFAASVAFAQVESPKTVRDYLRLIPSEYFSIACCDGDVDEFVKKYVTVEDNKNLYLKGEDIEEDPKYSGLVLTVFLNPNGKHVVGLHSYSINWSDYYFLELRAGKLVNISKTIPQYSLDNIYEFPQKGTTIGVYQKKFDSPKKILNADNGVSRGKKLYDLIWLDGKFTIKK